MGWRSVAGSCAQEPSTRISIVSGRSRAALHIRYFSFGGSSRGGDAGWDCRTWSFEESPRRRPYNVSLRASASGADYRSGRDDRDASVRSGSVGAEPFRAEHDKCGSQNGRCALHESRLAWTFPTTTRRVLPRCNQKPRTPDRCPVGRCRYQPSGERDSEGRNQLSCEGWARHAAGSVAECNDPYRYSGILQNAGNSCSAGPWVHRWGPAGGCRVGFCREWGVCEALPARRGSAEGIDIGSDADWESL